MLPNRQEVCQDLGGVKLIGQTVPDRHAGIGSELFHTGLFKAAVLDSVEHPAQNPCRVRNALLLPQL